MRNNLLYMAVLSLVFSSCQKLNRTLQQPAHLRVVNLMPDAYSLNISFYAEKKGSPVSESLIYEQPTAYKDIQQGKYLVKVTAHGKVLLSKQYGFGPDGYYTLIISGLSQLSMQPNQQTGKAKIRWIAGGASADLENGLLPQIHIYRDNVGGSEQDCKIRISHWAPGVVKANLSAFHSGKKEKLGSAAYAKNLTPKSYKKGNYDVLVEIGGGDKAVLKKQMNLQPCTLYTFIIDGTPDKGKPLNLIVLQNPLKPCLNK